MFKKITGIIHLWLGLASGLVVFVIAITGCLYAFQEEIQDLTQPYRFVAAQQRNTLPPSQIRDIADRQLPGKVIHAVLYSGKDRSVQAIYYLDEQYYYIVYINPYTGQVLKVKDVNSSFFQIVFNGHFYLWLPHHIGQPIVASATLIFFLLLISGLILWWKRKGPGDQRFRIKWNARWRRKNYDLHNVFGFYVMIIAIIFAVTGLIWGFEWFAKAVYKTASGGKDMVAYYDAGSDTTATNHTGIPAIDHAWLEMMRAHPEAEAIEVHVPENKLGAIATNANPQAATYWKIDYRYYDQHTLKEIPVDHTWNRWEKANAGDMIMRMNYDIHIGAILGFPGKVLAFLASLVVASLPVTGTLIWWGRRNK